MRTATQQTWLQTDVGLDREPLEAVARLVGAHAHEEYLVYEERGRWTYAGGVLAEVWLDRDGAHLRAPGLDPDLDPDLERDLAWDGDPLGRLQDLLDTLPFERWRAYGWGTFELSYATDGDRTHAGDERLLHLVVPRTEVVLDGTGSDGTGSHGTGSHGTRATVRATDPTSLALARAALLDAPAARPAGGAHRLDVRATGGPEYRDAVAGAVTDIHDAKLAKVILSRVVPVGAELDFLGTYLAGRRANTPARSFLMSMRGLDALGFSPEIVVRVEPDGRVLSQPLAGTRALTDDAARNDALRAELLADPKEVYEHAISVKTACDELVDVCKPDSLSVDEFMVVRPRGTVQHLASQVSGRLAEGRRPWDAFRAVFPAVTASGVPKQAAYTCIRDRESEPRGLYSGAVLAVGSDGSLDAALVLRSLYREHGRTWLRAGAGIVGQSTPEREFEETSEKLGSVASFLVAAPDTAVDTAPGTAFETADTAPGFPEPRTRTA